MDWAKAAHAHMGPEWTRQLLLRHNFVVGLCTVPFGFCTTSGNDEASKDASIQNCPPISKRLILGLVNAAYQHTTGGACNQ
eukprot:1150313-Pelagomonas_calceolata.AAC.1